MRIWLSCLEFCVIRALSNVLAFRGRCDGEDRIVFSYAHARPTKPIANVRFRTLLICINVTEHFARMIEMLVNETYDQWVASGAQVPTGAPVRH